MMTTGNWILLALGALLCAFNIWQLLGRTKSARAWLELTRPRIGPVHVNVFLLPALGYLLLFLGVVPLVEDLAVLIVVMGGVAVFALFAFLYWGLFTFPFPVRLVPGWAREEVRRRKESARQ